MVNLLETVIDHGTAAGVRSRGFTRPAAGKTGTSHDGWFAGFTTNLLAVVWVGYDDNHELGLSGGASALPVWTDFMKAASKLPAYHDPQSFVQPPGLITASIHLPDNNSSDPAPLAAYPTEIFIEGTEPHGSLAILSGAKSLFSRILHLGGSTPSGAAPEARPAPSSQPPLPAAQQAPPTVAVNSTAVPRKKKPNPVKRFFSLFKHNDSKSEATPDSPTPKQEDNSANPE